VGRKGGQKREKSLLPQKTSAYLEKKGGRKKVGKEKGTERKKKSG